MATLEVPTSTTLANYSEQVSLDGATFTLSFIFNAREGFWYLDIFDLLGNRVRSGIKVVINTPLLRLVAAIEAPPGELLAVETTGDDLEAGLTDLGDSATLIYIEAESVPT
jgi:hypothetical protein